MITKILSTSPLRPSSSYIAGNPDQVAQYRAGKDAVFGFFVGQAMKISKGKANPAQLNELLRNKLKAE